MLMEERGRSMKGDKNMFKHFLIIFSNKNSICELKSLKNTPEVN